MAGAIRMVSLSRGHDPRDFALFAFGGAGPLHAVALARELGLPEVLVPARPGLTNALGCLVADLRQDFVNTLNQPLDGARHGARCTRSSPRSASEGEALNAEEQSEIVGDHRAHCADMQFRGQTHLIRVPLPSRRRLARGAAGAVREGLFRPLPGASCRRSAPSRQPRHLGDRPAAGVDPVAALIDAGRARAATLDEAP